MKPDTINFIRYRAIGNCFVNCLVQACINLGDGNLSKDPAPEVKIFNIETLYSPKPEGELKPALDYVVNNGYKVKIIDPEPYRDNNWGSNLKHAQVQCPPRNYEIKDVEELLGNDWQVIISTEANRKPHAVLVTGDFIYDPIDERKWQQVSKKTKDLLKDYANRKEERFLIAIKK